MKKSLNGRSNMTIVLYSGLQNTRELWVSEIADYEMLKWRSECYLRMINFQKVADQVQRS